MRGVLRGQKREKTTPSLSLSLLPKEVSEMECNSSGLIDTLIGLIYSAIVLIYVPKAKGESTRKK